MDILQELTSKADQAEVLEFKSESTEVGFESNRLKSSQVQESKGIAVRVVREGKLGFAASSDERMLDKLASNAVESAAFGDEIPIAFPEPQPAPDVVTYDQAIVDLPISRLVEMGQEIIERILQVEPEALVGVGIERGIQHVTIRNQTGTQVSYQQSPLAISVDVSIASSMS